MRRVAWFYRGHLNLRNACRYQRLMAVAKRHQVVLYSKKGCAIPDDLTAQLQGVYRSSVTGWASLDSLLFLPFTLWRFFRLNRKQPFDIVWTPPDQSLVLGFLIKAMLRRRVYWVADMWDEPRLVLSSSRLSLRYWLTQAFGLFVKQTLRRADLVISVGDTLDADFPKVLQEYYRVPRQRITVVSNGVDLGMFRPRGVAGEASGFRVLYVGNVGRAYGADVVLGAAAALTPRIPGLQVVLVGSAVNQEEQQWLMEAITAPGLRDCVDCLGPQPSDTIPGLVETADVCLYPFPHGLGLDSVMPIKVYEYLAMGRCVVASDLSGVRAIIRHEENGLLVPSEDPQALAEAIYRLYTDPLLRSRLEANARKSVGHADWSRINAIVLQRVEALVGASKQGVPSAS